MNEKENKIIELMTNLSGILIPISLASMSLIAGGNIEETVKNILIFTIPFQLILLFVVLFINLNLYNNEQRKEIKTHLKYSKFCFFVALFFMAINHLLLFFQNIPKTQ